MFAMANVSIFTDAVRCFLISEAVTSAYCFSMREVWAVQAEQGAATDSVDDMFGLYQEAQRACRETLARRDFKAFREATERGQALIDLQGRRLRELQRRHGTVQPSVSP
jgi:hypothetical protein